MKWFVVFLALSLMLPAPRYWAEHGGGSMAWLLFTWIAYAAGAALRQGFLN